MRAAEIHALGRLLDRMDYYRLLRVEHDAPLSQVRAAYHRARRQFHPDAYLTAEPGLREAVDRIARRITEAYLTLRRPQRRSVYDKGLEAGELRYGAEAEEATRAEAQAAQGRTPNGRRFFAMALDEERAGNLKKAVEHLKMALTFERNHEGFRSKLADLEAAQKR